MSSSLAAAVALQDGRLAGGDLRSTLTERPPGRPAVQISVRRATGSGPTNKNWTSYSGTT